MKTLTVFDKICGVVILILFISAACTKSEDAAPSTDFPNSIREITTNIEARDKLRAVGMLIVEDNSRNDILFINGTYTVAHTCIYDSHVPANFEKVYGEYEISIDIFKRQITYTTPDNRDSSIRIDSMIVNSDNNNNFSIFFKADGITDGVRYKAIWIISGRLVIDANQRTSIRDLYDCYIMLEKGPDPGNKVADAGTLRVFKDPDKLSPGLTGSILKPEIVEEKFPLNQTKLITGKSLYHQ